MTICIIHKGGDDASSIGRYFYDSTYQVHEISLQKMPINQITTIIADVIIFDVTDATSNDWDTSFIIHLQKISKATPLLLATGIHETSKYRETMLDVGIDGCIQMPFLSDELFIRLEKLKNKKDSLLFSGTKIEVQNVEIDIRNHIVEVGGEKIPLTKTEYTILRHLLLHKGSIVSNKELSRYLEKEIGQDSVALNIHVFNLRKKMKDVHFIKTVPLYGFMVSNTLSTA